MPLLFTALSACVGSAPQEAYTHQEQCARLVCTDSYGKPLCREIEEDGVMLYNEFDYPAIVGIEKQTVPTLIELIIDGELSSFPSEEYSVEVEPIEARLRKSHKVYDPIDSVVGKLSIIDIARKNDSPIMNQMQYESGEKSVLVTFESEECGTQTIKLGGSHYQWLASQIWE